MIVIEITSNARGTADRWHDIMPDCAHVFARDELAQNRNARSLRTRHDSGTDFSATKSDFAADDFI